MTALERAIELVGSQAALAEKLNVTRAAVNQWKLPGRKVPRTHCLQIERITNRKVRAEDLRADLNWEVVRKELHHA